MNPVPSLMPSHKFLLRTVIVVVTGISLGACVTSRVEHIKESTTGIAEGEAIVIMAKSYHLGNETEEKFIDCVGNSIGRGQDGLRVIPHQEFVDALFPWFEPRTAPAETKGLPALMSRPRVAEIIKEKGVRYVIWLDGDTDKTAGGGSMSCAVGPGGGGCFGFAWWQNDSEYVATVWDLDGLEDAGTVSADVSGTSFLPAIIIPVPLIARTRSKACKGLADQLKLFIVADEEV